MTDIEFKQNINTFFEALSDISDLSIEAKVKSLLLLTVIERKDNVINKKIKNRLIKLGKKYPEIFRRLLPHRKKGFKNNN